MMNSSISRGAALATIKQLVEALNSPGSGRLKKVLADNAAWSSDLFDEEGDNPDASVTGGDGVAATMESLRDAFHEFAFGAPEESVVFEEGRAAFEFEVEGRNAGTLPYVGTTHRNTNFRGAALVTFDVDGRILTIRTTWNCARIMGQLGRHAHGRPGPRPDKQPVNA